MPSKNNNYFQPYNNFFQYIPWTQLTGHEHYEYGCPSFLFGNNVLDNAGTESVVPFHSANVYGYSNLVSTCTIYHNHDNYIKIHGHEIPC